MNFNSNSLTIARQKRLLNKKDLCEALGINKSTLSRWENEQTQPSNESLNKLSEILRFPKEFFIIDSVELIEPSTASFRSRKSMSSSLRDSALSAGSLCYRISDYIDSEFDLPSVNLPDLSGYTPQAAAIYLREEWNIGNRPISHMIKLLESKGAKIFSLDIISTKVNAFSVWRKDQPYVFLNTFKSGESSRFDVAHELGHLVLHQNKDLGKRDIEREADKFASEFLMPEEDLRAYSTNIYSLKKLILLKKRWGVSLAALCYALNKKNIISDWQYFNFCKQMSKNKYNICEPEGINQERSTIWEKIIKELWRDRITKEDLSKKLSIPFEELNAFVFGNVVEEKNSNHQGLELIS